MNGVVRFYTDKRSAMMFYKDGTPIGFYHDGLRTIETTPDEARKIAALPGGAQQRLDRLVALAVVEVEVVDAMLGGVEASAVVGGIGLTEGHDHQGTYRSAIGARYYSPLAGIRVALPIVVEAFVRIGRPELDACGLQGYACAGT